MCLAGLRAPALGRGLSVRGEGGGFGKEDSECGSEGEERPQVWGAGLEKAVGRGRGAAGVGAGPGGTTGWPGGGACEVRPKPLERAAPEDSTGARGGARETCRGRGRGSEWLQVRKPGPR